ncbi:MAG: hypothetical protein AAF961_14615 [Planctomycetota bacterium]
MHRISPTDYGPVFASLIDTDRLRSLGIGRADGARRDELEAATLDAAFAHASVVDREMARCCLAGVWLLHDFLDDSHAISQGVSTPTGSFWHGVMHRREGDFSNAKYWFRRVGAHEVYPALGEFAMAAASDPGTAAIARQVAPNGEWSASAFVDACQSAVRSGSHVDLCRKLQQAEWDSLFDYSYRGAVGN